MDESPANFLNVFHRAAVAECLEYFLIGGFAVSYWGTPRFTADVDYVTDGKNLEKVKKVTEQLGYKLVFLHPKQSFAHFVSDEKGRFRIDFMLVDDGTWQKLKVDASDADFGGPERLPIVAPLHLIAMKLHAAKQLDRTDPYKDLNDVAEILLAQGFSFQDLEKSGIIEKHGTEKTVAELRRILESRRK
ncbi:MAG: nucleotidyl transferase AbiEii/AbiGii toxin family protein [Bdellovibrionales bacterium]|nr:nucleotidyl transferase AbiEii/AbiGii toxin family protein [Bdellovibrionales bacterium]